MNLPLYITALVLLLVTSCALSFTLLRLRWHEAVDAWVDEREEFFRKLVSEAWTIVSVPDRTNGFSKSGGMVYYEGTMLNFDTLKEMTFLMIDMETERRTSTRRLSRLLGELTTWERTHPLPNKPFDWFSRKAGEPESVEIIPPGPVQPKTLSEGLAALQRGPNEAL